MFLKKILICTTVFCVILCQIPPVYSQEIAKPKNIILFIGDGMGSAHIKAFRMFKDDPETENVETLLFDSMLVGTLRTDPKMPLAESFLPLSMKEQNNGGVTDSAAAATAYATGFKTINGHISVDEDNRSLITVLEKAKHLGLSTGLVVTSQLTDATPAVFASHIKNRRKEKKIANQYIDNRYKGMPYVDVLLGGGSKYFIREDRNIAKEFESLGYHLVTNKKDLISSDNQQLLGLFGKKGMDKMLDRDVNTPSLADMTNAAIKQLSKNKKGFFLLVEGSQIDWAAHRNDIIGVMSEMQDFEDAVSAGLKFAKNNQETQILVTADHSTGGLSVGSEQDGKSYYQWNSHFVASAKATPEKIIERAVESGNLYSEIKKYTGFQLSKKEIKKLAKIEPEETKKALFFITGLVDRRSYTGWTTHGHTGVDVNLYAYGSQSQQLIGHWDNTKIGKFIFKLLEDL